ncbi:MAG: DeoR/GlpR family DNA-binding transcription regulator [Alicyclobacillus herbarius]|uniref:DeoR/GlpR family DNA-binding transcription regulator n=1 Tax=Alicyclobacillus herbarius TaxID=122960 RepID=UPI002354C0D4|nr:DeoR/GlpR family DNA-binding transcription regulator [Alicyclobacillus herbarius]MCL6633668.1 DeoR/GlpR family DNA-binding transcription regulator [Alicyclobacillus herbarius]
MLNVQRQQEIVDIIREKRSVTVSELAERFAVSDMTIRRDLDLLEKKGIVRKIYGGAVLADYIFGGPQEITMDERRVAQTEAKRRIGEFAAGLVDKDDIIILDAGTTTLPLAKSIRPSPNLVIITNSIPIAYELTGSPVNLLLVGGDVRVSTHSTVGPKAKQFLEGLHARKFFLGASALSLENGLMNFNLYDAEIKRKMMEISDQVILVADSTKFASPSHYTFAQWHEVDMFITDSGISPDIVAKLRKQGVRVEVV